MGVYRNRWAQRRTALRRRWVPSKTAGGGTTYTKTGSVIIDNSVLSGADVTTHIETGSVVIDNAVLSGGKSGTWNRTGAVIINNAVLSGPSSYTPSVVAVVPLGTLVIGPPPRAEVNYLLLRPGLEPLRVTPVGNSLRFSTLAVGGFGACSFKLAGQPARWYREIPYLSKLIVTYGSRVIYEGQVEDIARTIGKDGLDTTVTCYGYKRLLEEVSLLRVYSKRDFQFVDQWAQAGHPQAWAFSQGRFDSANLSRVGVMYKGANAASIPDTEDRNAAWYPPTGMNVYAVAAKVNLAGSNAQGRIWSILNDGSFTSEVIYNADSSGSPLVSMSSPSTTVGFALGARVKSNPSRPVESDLVRFYNLRALCTSLAEDVNDANNPDTSGYYGGTLLRDLLASIPGIRVGTIESGSDFTIPAAGSTGRRAAQALVDEITGYYTREWGVWEDARFDWTTPNLAEPQWLVPFDQLADLDLTSSIKDLGLTTYLLYSDAALGVDAEISQAATQQRNPYVKQNRTKDVLVSAGFPMTPVSATQLAATLVADQGGFPSLTGHVSLPANAYVQHAVHGPVPAILIRAGENLLVPDLPKTEPLSVGRDGETLLHIISTDYDESAQKVTLEVEGYSNRADALLARLAAVTRIRTG